jgi:DNA-binding NarL/FixJ family response regulator
VTALSQPDTFVAPPRPVFRAVPEARYVILSWRQIDVLRELIKDGASNIEIARRLDLSEDTVKTHFKAIFRKIGGGNRISAVIGILRGRIVILDPRQSRAGF